MSINNESVIIKLEGRLGHQLTSYAFALVFSKLNNLKLYVDLSILNKKGMIYYLDKLGIHVEQIENNSLRTINENKSSRFLYQPKFFDFKKRPICLRGCWIHYKYTENIINDLKKQISPPIKNNYTTIHVRRTDFLKGRNDSVLSPEWIRNAMAFLPGPYCILSDDIDWCLENIYADEYRYNDAISDFRFIMGSQNKIISDSSFSWWAARLGDNNSVIVPKIHSDKDNIHPKEWTLL